MRRKIFVLSLAFILSVVLIGMGLVEKSRLRDEVATHFQKSYVVVDVRRGDSLWDIASEHYNDLCYTDMRIFVDEICVVNSISDPNVIVPGSRLTIPVMRHVSESNYAQVE